MLKTEKTALHAALASVIDVVKANSDNPVMSHVLVERVDDGVSITGGNLSIEVRSNCPAVVTEGFRGFTCPAHRLIDIVRNAADTSITIDLVEDGRQVQVRSGRSKLKLPAMQALDYPKLNIGRLEHTVSLSSEIFAKALSGVAFAAETAIARPHLCGVHVHPTEHGMDVVATDGRIVARRLIQRLAFDEDVSHLPAITIPNAAIRPIEKLLADGEDVEIQFSRQMIVFTVGQSTLSSKLLEETYPSYTRIMPADEGISASISAAALGGAVKRVKIATPDASYGMTFRFSRTALTLSARDQASGEGEDELPIEANGELITGFNGQFVLDALAHLDDEKLEFRVGTDAAPAMLRRPGDDFNYIILMPTRVRAG